MPMDGSRAPAPRFAKSRFESGTGAPRDAGQDRAAPAIPSDPALPQLGRLLDTDAVVPVLERSLPGGMPVADVAIRYLRYKPCRSALVQYDMSVGGVRQEAVVVAAPDGLVKRARRLREVLHSGSHDPRPAAPQPLRYDTDLDALVQWPPLDIWLPALAEPSANLIQALRHLGLEATEAAPAPVRLSYKPRRRVVLSFGGHVLKAYVKHADFEAATSGLRSSRAVRGFRTARLEGALPTLNLAVQSWVPGRQPSDPLEAAPLAAAMLRALHDRPVNRGGSALTVRAQAMAVAASADLVRTVLPHLSERLDALVRLVAATAPELTGAVPSHGDFHAGQLLIDGDGAGLIDFDEACLAPPAFDLGSYAARMVRGEEGDLDSASRALDVLAGCYGRPEPGLRWSFATSILRRANSPLRYFHSDWPARTEKMVDAASRALTG